MSLADEPELGGRCQESRKLDGPDASSLSALLTKGGAIPVGEISHSDDRHAFEGSAMNDDTSRRGRRRRAYLRALLGLVAGAAILGAVWFTRRQATTSGGAATDFPTFHYERD